ncbi:uncharacterized protein LOC112525978 [Cynara cardunculus var. scolymus]|uniref:Uncharacterized protein n=1 Tax=Cynara cardunculus var. scolymus TaxID=59895 RepID=A0A118K4K5_CYNCS|nr:uncharacterized protein LOC112525978 [Cynara cardunculus var. scolymus]KVI07698.1 hypothetical protein Ccrd_013930 [Cynara cardunculus var. scolymus]
MSKMMRSDRKPPLAMRSPIRLRPRRGSQTTVNNLQTPSASFTKSCLPKQSSDVEEPELHPEYHTISSELRALTKMVQDNLRGSTDTNQSSNAYNGTPLFERGKFYDEYSARRNERLRRKRGESGVEKKTPCKQYLGVKMESTKRTGEIKKFESAKKMTTPLIERREVATTQRYSLRSSSKENKKPPLAMSFDRSIGGTVEKKTAMKRTARKGY